MILIIFALCHSYTDFWHLFNIVSRSFIVKLSTEKAFHINKFDRIQRHEDISHYNQTLHYQGSKQAGNQLYLHRSDRLQSLNHNELIHPNRCWTIWEGSFQTLRYLPPALRIKLRQMCERDGALYHVVLSRSDHSHLLFNVTGRFLGITFVTYKGETED